MQVNFGQQPFAFDLKARYTLSFFCFYFKNHDTFVVSFFHIMVLSTGVMYLHLFSIIFKLTVTMIIGIVAVAVRM